MTVLNPGLEGTLEDLEVTQLFALLESTGATGELRIFAEPTIDICLEAGRIRVATAGPFALRAAIESEFAVEPAVFDGAMERSTTLLGLVKELEASPELDAKELGETLFEHTIGSAFELMLEHTDPFQFFHEPPGAAPSAEIAAGFDAAEVLGACKVRVDRWREIAKTVPSTNAVMAMSAEPPCGDDPVTISADDWRFIATLDGQRTVAEVMANQDESAFAICERLHELAVAGFVELRKS